MPLKATKGAKSVRLFGVGSEKSQITVTFTLKETGDVVGIHQLIFGGKTDTSKSSASKHVLRPYYEPLADTCDLSHLP